MRWIMWRRAVKMQAGSAVIAGSGGVSARTATSRVEMDNEIGPVVAVTEALQSPLKVPISTDTCNPGELPTAIQADALSFVKSMR